MKTQLVKRIYFILIGLIISISHNLANDCACISRDSSVSIGLRYSDIAFYGELIKFDTINLTFQFKINDLFKGSFSRDTILGRAIPCCKILPRDKGLWIVYADFNQDSSISISYCSQSKSLLRAEGLLSPIPPPLDPPAKYNKVIDFYKVKIFFLEQRIESISYWFSDLEKLRMFKKNHTVFKEKFDYKSYWIIILVLMNVILMILLLTKRK